MNGQVWLTTATVEGHDYYAIGIDAETGAIRHNVKLFHLDDPEPLGNGASMNCYATPSSVIEPGRVYVHFGSPGTACLDTGTGKLIWKRDDLPCRHYRGASSSLVEFENLIILTMDGADLQYHVALDKATGETVW
jgi:outer membrane protein assembly factor BamB